jgi:hypothetical protein
MTALVGTITQAGRWQSGMEYTAVGKYTLVGAIVSADTITFTSLLPANDTIIQDFVVYGQEFDTNASPTATLIVGDGTDTDAYLASKTAGDANGQMQFFGDGAAIGTSDQVGRNVVLTVGGTVATAASSGTVWVKVRYYCSGE